MIIIEDLSKIKVYTYNWHEKNIYMYENTVNERFIGKDVPET